VFFNERTKKPPAKPINMAKIALAIAKINPNSPTVIKKDDGSINGEDSHNAVTADNGAPATNNAAMKGITSQEQKGASPPTMEAKTIIFTSFP
jgi:hypothetical protein